MDRPARKISSGKNHSVSRKKSANTAPTRKISTDPTKKYSLDPTRKVVLDSRKKMSLDTGRMAISDIDDDDLDRKASIFSPFFWYRERVESPRTDVWPEPKTSVIEERFLNLPESEDYTRVRQFKIDEKGAVVSRGDSFRLKSPNAPKKGSHVIVARRSIPSNASVSSHSTTSGSSPPSNENDEPDNVPSTSATSYKIFVLGATGVGKTALIGQFMTSEHRNTFATDIEPVDNTVSVLLGGHEFELSFYEADPNSDESWIEIPVHMYLLVYSIDSKSSFKQAMYIVERLRESASTRDIPIIMAGNKVDLERKRAVGKHDKPVLEAKNGAAAFAFVHYEISVALHLDVDDLLVGLIAEIKDSLKPESNDNDENTQVSDETGEGIDAGPNEFKAAIRRYSKRKREQMGGAVEMKTSMCTNFKSNLMERFRSWRRSLPKLPQ